MKMRLKKPIVERKWATSPRFALPRNILNSTWMSRRQLGVSSASEHRCKYLQSVYGQSHKWFDLQHAWWSHLVESWCWSRAHSQSHSHKGIAMKTVGISHHHNACDGHYGCHNLQVKIQNHESVLLKQPYNVSWSLVVFSYRPEHPWSGPWERSRTRERQRPCGSSRGRRHQWRSASSRPAGTGSWSVSTGLRMVLSSSPKSWESSHPPRRVCCTPWQKGQNTLTVFEKIQQGRYCLLLCWQFTWISVWGSACPVWWPCVRSNRWGRRGCSSCCWTRRWRKDRRTTGRSA